MAERTIPAGSRRGPWKVKPGQAIKVSVPCTITVGSVDGRVVSLWFDPLDPHYEFQKVLQDDQPPG